MSQQDFENYENESDQNGDASLYTRFPVSSLPGKGAVLVLLGSGSLLAGLGLLQSFYLSGAFGESSVAGGLAQRAGEIGWTPGILTIGGLMMIGLGSIARSLLNTGRNLLGEIVDLPDPSNTLEELDVQQQKLHVNMVNVQSSIERSVQTSFKSLREQLLGIEGRIYNVESTMGGGGDRAADEQEREQALARFAVKLDSFSGRIEAKIDQRLEQFEQGLGEELAEVTSSIAETLVGKVRDDEAERRAEQERARSAREVADRARREAEAKTAAAAPVLPEIDSLGVFDALDDEGRPVQSQPAPSAAAVPQHGTQQQQLSQRPPAPPAAQGHPQPQAPAPNHAQQGTRMETPGPPPQSAPRGPAPSPLPAMLGGQTPVAHQEPGAHWEQQAVRGGQPSAPGAAEHPGQAAPPAAPQSMGQQPTAPQFAQAPRLDETAVRPELRLVDGAPDEPAAPLPQTPPAREERRLEAFDPYGDYSSPVDPSAGPQQH